MWMSTQATIRDKQPSKWRIRIKRARIDPVGFSYRALNSCRWKLYFALLNLFCDVLFRWGDKLGVSGNFRARMYLKANRSEIVPEHVLRALDSTGALGQMRILVDTALNTGAAEYSNHG